MGENLFIYCELRALGCGKLIYTKKESFHLKEIGKEGLYTCLQVMSFNAITPGCLWYQVNMDRWAEGQMDRTQEIIEMILHLVLDLTVILFFSYKHSICNLLQGNPEKVEKMIFLIC